MGVAKWTCPTRALALILVTAPLSGSVVGCSSSPTERTGDASPPSFPAADGGTGSSPGPVPSSGDSGLSSMDSATPSDDSGQPATDSGTAPSPDSGGANDAGTPPLDSGTPPGTFMAAPSGWSHSQLVWETQFGYSGMGSSPAAPNQGSFAANGVPKPDTSVGFLNDWNYGIQQKPGSIWSQSGSSPYWGSCQCASGFSEDYSFPGNLFQTSTGANTALFGGYASQTFLSNGTGLSLADRYVGSHTVAIQSNGTSDNYLWTSAVINTEDKRYFPTSGATEFYAQVSAKMAGPNTGSWSAIWMLPDQAANGTGQEIDIQEYNVSGADAYAMYSHVQNPAVQVGTGKSSTPLCDGYHVYGWDVNSATQTLTLYLDGVQTGTFTGAQVGSKYFLILDASISSGTAAWETSEGFVSDSNAPMDFGIGEVQVYQP